MLAMTKPRSLQLCFALLLGAIILILPRPEGTKFKITGDVDQNFLKTISDQFTRVPTTNGATDTYVVKIKEAETAEFPGELLKEKAAASKMTDIKIDYVNGLSSKAKRFLAILAVLIFLFTCLWTCRTKESESC